MGGNNIFAGIVPFVCLYSCTGGGIMKSIYGIREKVLSFCVYTVLHTEQNLFFIRVFDGGVIFLPIGAFVSAFV